MDKRCSETGCEKSAAARGLCGPHYRKAVRTGQITAEPVRTRVSLVDAFWARVSRGDDCWTWTGSIKTEASPYGKFWYRGRMVGRAHRVAWELVNGPIPEGLIVLHRCDNPRCVRAESDPKTSHLFLGTHSDNMADMVSKGRDAWSTHPEMRQMLRAAPRLCGEKHPSSKISDDDAREFFRLRASGAQLRAIASRYGVSVPLVSRILSGERRPHLLEPTSA